MWDVESHYTVGMCHEQVKIVIHIFFSHPDLTIHPQPTRGTLKSSVTYAELFPAHPLCVIGVL
jgi:hypothetical protein